MNFNQAYPIVREANCRDSFMLAPASTTVLLSQACNVSNRTTHSDDLNVSDMSSDFESPLLSYNHIMKAGNYLCDHGMECP